MLNLNLAPLFKARGIEKPYTFLVKAGLTPHTATNFITNKVITIIIKHIELLCNILFCEPNDLFMWTPDSKHPLASNHPLLKVGKQEESENFKAIISTMPLKKLKEITKTLVDNSNL